RIRCRCGRSRNGCSATRAVTSATTSSWRPRARSASILSSRHVRRSSSRWMRSASANGSENSASAGPRHNPSACTRRAAAAGASPASRDADDVARPPREENGVRERLAKLRDEDLHHLRCRRRSVVAPQVADEAVGGNGAVGVEQEPREERPLLPVPEENRRGAVDDLERPEQPELHTVVYRLIRDRVNPTAYRTTTAPQPARS